MDQNELDCLDISKLPTVQPSHAVPPRYDPFSLMRVPGFWEGAIHARGGTGPENDNLHRLRILAERNGSDITESAEFRRWLG
jgi:hypothetical protein